jgi:phosphoglycolate phosphatase
MPGTKKIKLVIFDWDDVFTLGSTEGYVKCYQQALSGVGVVLEPTEFNKRLFANWGKPFREELNELLKGRPELLNEACRICDKSLFGDTFVNSLLLVPGSIELLESLHNKKYILALATGAHPQILRDRIFPKFAIPDVFSQIVTVHDIVDPNKSKPHPHMVEQIIKKHKISPAETVYVGDARNDVLMAQAAGVVPIVVLTGHLSKAEAEALGVTYIIPDVTHVENLLKSL